MKDLIITSKRLKKRNIYSFRLLYHSIPDKYFSIITFKTPWYEMFTQIGYVIIISITLYLLVAMVRAVALLMKRLIKRAA